MAAQRGIDADGHLMESGTELAPYGRKHESTGNDRLDMLLARDSDILAKHLADEQLLEQVTFENATRLYGKAVA